LTLPISPIHPAILAEVRVKPTVVLDEDGEWVWVRRPTPEQDRAWIELQHKERDAFLSLARRQSKLSVQYRRWAEEDARPDRAAHYATEATRLRRDAKWHLRKARERNV
jgi:hypothetical protein